MHGRLCPAPGQEWLPGSSALEVLGTEREVQDCPGAAPLPPARGHLRLEDVTFGYEPGRPVLHGVSLEVLPGQTVAVVGFTDDFQFGVGVDE